MFADARAVTDGAVIDADLCIVGAGAAGITIARELTSATRRVVVLESGFVEPDPLTQTLYDGESHGLAYFELGDPDTRTRQFGGSTNRWNGECRPLTAYDFEARAWMPDSGWPFDLVHLTPWYERAQRVCELGPYEYTTSDASLDDTIEQAVIQYSPPARFALAAHDELERADRTTVFLGANVVDLATTQSGRALDHVEVATIGSGRFIVRAAVYVLATGGIENARLLLASDRVVRGGIGNGHDLVGRCFMEHLYLDDAATVALRPKFVARYGHDQRLGAQRVRFALTLSEATQRAEELPGTTFVVTPRRSTGRFGRAQRAVERVATSLRSEVSVPVKLIQEQVPNRESRVTLSRARDDLGCWRAALAWRVSPRDAQAAARSCGILDQSLRAAHAGRVVGSRLDGAEWPPDLRGARHHMGTTRMHPDPARGVVDADGRVHGVANLYVAGSSVFPTSGTANPTLTILALALRLADHLGTKVPNLAIRE